MFMDSRNHNLLVIIILDNMCNKGEKQITLGLAVTYICLLVHFYAEYVYLQICSCTVNSVHGIVNL